ncbi:MAG: type I methionyl aminopeptidase [Pirellulaceae bacterium]
MAPGTQPRVLRSKREIGLMRNAGLLVWHAHQAAARLIRPGVTTGELDSAIVETFAAVDATPLFLGYPGKTPFPAVSCISINEELVHGIPGERQLTAGDIVSIDTGAKLNGWCGDAAVTHAVGEIDSRANKLLKVTNGALELAIALMATKKMWSEVAREIQDYVEGHKFSVVTDMVGHGIGQSMHEPPQVPNYYDDNWVQEDDFDLRPGVVLAIEPMVNVGTNKLRHLSDHWTAITKDKSLCAHFEHTVAMTTEGPRRLTGPPGPDEKADMPDWLQDDDQWYRW